MKIGGSGAARFFRVIFGVFLVSSKQEKFFLGLFETSKVVFLVSSKQEKGFFGLFEARKVVFWSLRNKKRFFLVSSKQEKIKKCLTSPSCFQI